MSYRLLCITAFVLFVLPFFMHIDSPIYITLDCPACAYAMQKSPGERIYLVDGSFEVNCLLKQLHKIDPEKQSAFIQFYRKNRSHIRLQEFCAEENICLDLLTPCKNCTHLWELEMQEILIHVMRYGITTVPSGGKNRKH